MGEGGSGPGFGLENWDVNFNSVCGDRSLTRSWGTVVAFCVLGWHKLPCRAGDLVLFVCFTTLCFCTTERSFPISRAARRSLPGGFMRG